MTNFQQDRFTETQAFGGWAYAVLGLTTVVSLGSLAATPRAPSWLWLYAAVPLALVFNLLCLRTTVTDRELVVTLGALFPLFRRRIRLAEIVSTQADTYAPLAEYGGWGIKGLPGNIALNARGNRGVRLTLQNGRRVLVGSQRPDALVEALAVSR